MGLCCCGMFRNKEVKHMATQTDTIPLVEAEFQRRSSDNEAKYRSSLESALRLVRQAVEADRSKHYEEALSLYQHALVYFLESLNYEVEGEAISNKILSKCKQYLDRAETLAEYLQTNNISRRGKPSSLTEVSISVSKWIDNEQATEETPRSSAVSRMYHSIMRKSRKQNNNNTSMPSDVTDLHRSHSSRR